MVGEIFEIHLSQLNKNSLKLSNMVGENFEIHLSQLTKTYWSQSVICFEIDRFLSIFIEKHRLP